MRQPRSPRCAIAHRSNVEAKRARRAKRSKKEFFALLCPSCPFCFFSSRYSKRASEPSGLLQAPPFSLHGRSDPPPPDAGKFVEEVGGARIEGEMHVERAGEDVLARDEAPKAAVLAVVAAVAHHKVLVLGHLDRFAHAIDSPGIDLEVVPAGIMVGVVEDSVLSEFGLRFDFDDRQFRFLR